MEDSRFDDITRALARPRSRRGFLAGAAAFAAGILGGRASAGAAPSCREAGHPCEGNQTCCDGLVCVVSGPGNATRCTPCPAGQIECGGVCIPACTALDQCHVAGVCDPVAQACTNPPAIDGTACNDGNACTQTDTCQAGVCVGSNRVVCTAQDQCHVAGQCDPATGSCSNPNAPDGIGCNDGNACTEGDICLGGVCQGGAAVVCPNNNPCMDVTCNPASGCVETPKPAGISCDADANACTVGDACDGQGNCLPGQPRNCPPCQRCNNFNGTCEPDPIQDGHLCPGDGNRCFGEFRCNVGNCVGVQPVVCTPQDQCHVAGVCDPANGTCSNPDAPNGISCNDGNACTQTDTCQGGVCRGDNPVVCPALDQCHAPGTCDPATGTCSNPVAVGRACDDQDPCTENDVCRPDGTCTGTPKPCDDNNVCTANTCNATTGACEFPPVPNNTVSCPTASGAPGRCTDGRCCAPTQSVCNVTADCCLGTNICVNGRCQPSPQCNQPLQREQATRGFGTAGTSQCQRTPTTCEQTMNVSLTGALPNTTYRAIIDQGSTGSPATHIDVGFFTTDSGGNATFTGTITVGGTCPNFVDNEIVLAAAAYDQHQYIQQSFQPCRFCAT